MSGLILCKVGYQEFVNSTADLIANGGMNYSVYRGVANGEDVKVMVGQDFKESSGCVEWHMSISSKEPLDEEDFNLIVSLCWPDNVRGTAGRHENLGLHFIHVFELVPWRP